MLQLTLSIKVYRNGKHSWFRSQLFKDIYETPEDKHVKMSEETENGNINNHIIVWLHKPDDHN
jgi:hypothetical protein